jgi:hypothetical protein
MDQPDLFPTMPRLTLEKTDRELWNDFRKEQDEMGGLVVGAAARFLLGVSRQRLHQIVEAKLLRSCVHFGQRYYSAADIEQRLADKRDGIVGVGRPSRLAAA